MKIIVLSIMAWVCTTVAYGQNTFTAFLKDAESKQPLIGATAFVRNTANGVTSDASGQIILTNIPDGPQIIRFSYVGYAERIQTISFPRSYSAPITIFLTGEEAELEAIEITSTRSTRTIQDIPTRVEFIAGEELEEKGNVKPGDIRMILSESTGIQTQQTSATSANASIRIQGLDGRYTQILKDGFPLYAGYAGGLGLLQTPPLDLKQVEVIKGSASTLYGGGAIAGLVNLISKTPQEAPELRLLLNGTSAGGLDLNGYYGKRFDKVGVTVFAARNSNAAYDPSNTDLSAIPQFSRYTLNPRLFLYPTERTQINLGINTVLEDRLGGDMQYIKKESNGSTRYFERNKTQRLSSQLAINHRFSNNGQLTFKNSISYFNRTLNLPQYTFDGNQVSTFTEANYSRCGDKTEWVVGVNAVTDQFREKQLAPTPLRNYNQTTFGGFLQNSFRANNWLNVETGLRGDFVLDYGFALLPRVSALFKLTPALTSRLGGGLGYKAPTIFTEETERLQFKGILPVTSGTNKLERSYGANWDFTYRTSFAEDVISFTINHLFFFTYLNNPLMLFSAANEQYQLRNIGGHIDTKGSETNIKMGYEDLNLFLGYTFTNTRKHERQTTTTTPLTPNHRVNAVLMYEVEEKWKLGLGAYYFGEQRLSDGTTGKPYVINGFMAEKLWKRFSLYLNFENFLDVRQTRFDTIYTGNISNPIFRDIYAPLDGFVVNGGLKIRL